MDPSTPVSVPHLMLCTSIQIVTCPQIRPLIYPSFVPFPFFLLSRDPLTLSLIKHLLRPPVYPELRSGEREKFDWFPDVGSLIALGRWVWSSRHGHRPGLFSVVRERSHEGLLRAQNEGDCYAGSVGSASWRRNSGARSCRMKSRWREVIQAGKHFVQRLREAGASPEHLGKGK